MLMTGLEVVLAGTRFPENVGMAARACANMGCPALHLAYPELWNRDKAVPLATPKGLHLLDCLQIYSDLKDAIAESQLVLATTARRGGWRREIMSPEAAARMVAKWLEQGWKVSLVFGPEDRGLNNREIVACQGIINIPTEDSATSLNLAQAVLVILYECRKAWRQRLAGSMVRKEPPCINQREQSFLLLKFREMLEAIDWLHGANTDYFMQPWQRLFSRAALRRYEYNALLGLCRQVCNHIRPRIQEKLDIDFRH